MLEIQKNLTNSFYALLSLPATAMGFALSVQISALSWILSTKYGLEIHDIGLVWAAGPLAGIIGQVLIGLISDNVWFWGGRRRPFILIGGVIAALMLLALPNIDVINASMGMESILGVAIAVALSLDLAINISFNPTRSVIADITPEGPNRTKAYTWMQTVSGFFGVLAYAIGAIWNNYILIYFGAFLVLAFSLLPPLLIKESRHLKKADSADDVPTEKASLTEILLSIESLLGFLIYAIYGLVLRLAHIDRPDHYYVEIACGVLTLLLIGRTLFKSEVGKSPAEAGQIGFKKVLAAHSFTWLGVQTMFVYMVAFVQQKLPELSDINQGKVISISFLLLNLVGALLPAFVLEPATEKIGRVKTHYICIAIMALGYMGLVTIGNSTFMIYIMMCVLGVGWAATVSLPFAIFSEKIAKEQMGLYMGIFNLSVVIPQLVVSMGLGIFISQADNKNLIFIICAISLAISAIFWTQVKETEGIKGENVSGGGGH